MCATVEERISYGCSHMSTHLSHVSLKVLSVRLHQKMSMYDNTLHGALGHSDTAQHTHNLLCGQLCSQKLNAADVCVIFSIKI
jgi:hypothetical protein